MIYNSFVLRRSALACVAVGFSLTAFSNLSMGAMLVNDGGTTLIDGVSDDLEVRDSSDPLPTTVDVVAGAVVGGGADASIAVFDTSIVNLIDGELLESFVASGNSVSTITGGSIGNDVISNDTATVNISGGSGDDLFINDASTINLTGGSFDTVEATGGTFNFSGGRVDDIDSGAGTSRFNISGDALVDDDAFFTGNSVVRVSGGQFDDEFQLFDNTAAFFSGGAIDDDLVVAGNAFVSIANLTVGDTIEAEGSSLTVIGGGTFGAIEAAEDARAFLFGGTVEEGVSALLGGTVNIGNATLLPVDDGPEVTATLNGSVNLTGTTLDELGISAGSSGRVVATDINAGAVEIDSIGSSVMLDGGSADTISVFAELESLIEIDGTDADTLSVFADTDSQVEIHGGLFDSGDLEARDGSTITIFGSGFSSLGISLDAGPIPFVAGDIKGFLADGSPFDFTFRRDFGAGLAAQIVLVPEPTAITLTILFAATVFGTRRRSF